MLHEGESLYLVLMVICTLRIDGESATAVHSLSLNLVHGQRRLHMKPARRLVPPRGVFRGGPNRRPPLKQRHIYLYFAK